MQTHGSFFHSPYFIFIKGIAHFNDEEVLRLLDFQEFQQVEKGEEDFMKEEHYVHLTRDENWVHIMDNWFYTLWHAQEFRGTIHRLGKMYDIFDCSVGECDDSFHFTYCKDGQVVRRYIVADPDFNGGEVIEDMGTPIPSEEKYLKMSQQQTKVISIARSIGIEVKHDLMDIKCYEILKPQYRLFDD